MDELLAPRAALLASLERACVDIEVTAVPERAYTSLEPDGMEARASKLGGTPFTPSGKTWPVDKNGRRLALVAQVNFAEVPPVDELLAAGFPREGILQAFEAEYGTLDEDDFGLVRFFDASEARAPHVAEAPTAESAVEHPSVTQACRMRFAPGRSLPSASDESFGSELARAGLGQLFDYDDEAFSEAGEALYDRFAADGCRIGGYASFTQSDPREGQDDPDLQALQIDSGEHVMFGDCGIAHVFIPRVALARGDWEAAYFYWDCC